jgi:translation elongation factor EF-G
VLTVNKMDRCFLELKLDGEEAYTTYLRVIENANVILATYQDEAMGDLQVGTGWEGYDTAGVCLCGMCFDDVQQRSRGVIVTECCRQRLGSVHVCCATQNNGSP